METVVKEKVEKKACMPLWKKLVISVLVVAVVSAFSVYSYWYLSEVAEVDFSKGLVSAVKEILGIYPDKEEQSLVLSEEIERLGLADVHFPKEAFDEKYIITDIRIVDTSYTFDFRIRDSETIGFFSVFFPSVEGYDFANDTSVISTDVEQIEHLKVDGTDIVIWSLTNSDMLRASYVYDCAAYDIVYSLKDYDISFDEFREFMQIF